MPVIAMAAMTTCLCASNAPSMVSNIGLYMSSNYLRGSSQESHSKLLSKMGESIK
jgi:hypothetical protein